MNDFAVTDDSDILAAAVQHDFGDPRSWVAPAGYPNSLALCVIDAVQSIGVTYKSVEHVLDRYRAYRREGGADPSVDGSSALLESFESVGGPIAWSQSIGNENRTSSHQGAPLKAEVIEEAAQQLMNLGIPDADTFRARLQSADDEVESMWLALPGQRSGISWFYFQMLLGMEGFKPDRMIMSYLRRTLPNPPGSPRGARELLMSAAAALNVSSRALDHRIWLGERENHNETANDTKMSTSWTHDELLQELELFERAARSAGLAENSVRTYADRSRIFVQWLAGDYEFRGPQKH